MHGDEVGVDGAAGELVLHLVLAPPQQHRPQAPVQLAQVLVSHRPAALVQLVEVAVEAEEGAEDPGIQELDDGVEIVDAVLQRRAGQDEGVPALQALDRLRRLGAPVLDPLRLVQDDRVRRQQALEVLAVGHHLLVVGQVEEGALPVLAQPRGPGSDHRHRRQVGELGDLLLPLGLERDRADHQHPLDPLEPPQQLAGGDRLDRLAQAHLVAEQGAFREGQVERPFLLVGVEALA